MKQGACSWPIGQWVCFALLLAFKPVSVVAQEPVCSVVKIQIQQELTLERQAFDAHMRITNGLDLTALEDIDINVWFQDADGTPVQASSDPDNTSALFFITLDQATGITGGVDGNGTIGPGAQADIYWLIIPAPGAGGEASTGELYQVGATLSYRFGGEQETVNVAPDFIQVRPMPMLALDYFLPEEVIGEDPLAPGQQQPIPFPLAVRVSNIGFGPANNLAIESAQPEIIDNDQGLLINFELLSTQVNDGPVINSLLAEFGDLGAGESATAIWSMMVSLYGSFVYFEADYYHSDTLGGSLTSLIDEVRTHTLVGLVLNDLPGRDDRQDFLARDGDVLRLYESEGIDTDVVDRSAGSKLKPTDSGADYQTWEWEFPPASGPVYAVVEDPTDGEGEITSIWRSDGKVIVLNNYWQMPTKPDQEWINQIHLFDTNSTGFYQVTFNLGGSIEAELLVVAETPLVTSEQGQSASFTVALSSQPEATVALPLASSDPSEGQVSPDVLAFDADNWNIPQTVTVTGVDDYWLDGDVPYEVLIGPSSSADALFDGLDHPPLAAINLDSDTAGLIVSPTSGLATAGEQSSAEFEIRLNARPLAPVTVTLESTQPQWGVPTEGSVVLDADNWNVGVPVTVLGQDDASTAAGTHGYQVSATVSAGEQPWLALEPVLVDLVHRAGETWALAAGRVELPALTDTSDFIDVDFEHPFDSTPVVVLIGDDGEPAPASIRLDAIDEAGFRLVQVKPSSQFSLSGPMVVHYLAIEPGTRVMTGGASIEAGITSVDSVQGGSESAAWQSLDFSQSFDQRPLLLTAIQSLANEQAELPQAGSRPFLTVATGEISSTHATVALERSGLMEGDVEHPEQVGWIAFSGQSGQFESGAGLVLWQTASELAVPASGSCADFISVIVPADDAVMLAGLAERYESGGWLRLCEGEEYELSIMLQQSGEHLQGDPGDHLDADVLIFSKPFHTRLPYLPDFLFRDRFSQQED